MIESSTLQLKAEAWADIIKHTNRIYYGSPILLLSFYCVTEEQFRF